MSAGFHRLLTPSRLACIGLAAAESPKTALAQTDLLKPDLTFYLDGRRKTAFSYDPAKDRLAYTPTTRLSYGRHTVKIVARDAGGSVRQGAGASGW